MPRSTSPSPPRRAVPTRHTALGRCGVSHRIRIIRIILPIHHSPFFPDLTARILLNLQTRFEGQQRRLNSLLERFPQQTELHEQQVAEHGAALDALSAELVRRDSAAAEALRGAQEEMGAQVEVCRGELDARGAASATLIAELTDEIRRLEGRCGCEIESRCAAIEHSLRDIEGKASLRAHCAHICHAPLLPLCFPCITGFLLSIPRAAAASAASAGRDRRAVDAARAEGG